MSRILGSTRTAITSQMHPQRPHPAAVQPESAFSGPSFHTTSTLVMHSGSPAVKIPLRCVTSIPWLLGQFIICGICANLSAIFGD